MKKKTFLLITLIIMLVSLTACGNSRTQCGSDCNCQLAMQEDLVITTESESSSSIESTEQVEDTLKDEVISSEQLEEFLKNEVNLTDRIEIANFFAKLYDDDVWNGSTINYKDFVVEEKRGEIYMNDGSTGVKTSEGILYDKIKEKYLNTDWDGNPVEFENHKISLSEYSGYILVDDHAFVRRENLDMLNLKGFEDVREGDTCYIPRKGTYFISNKKLYKCTKGEIVSVSEYNLDGIITQFDFDLSYFKEIDKLFLVVNQDDQLWGEMLLYLFEEYDDISKKPELLGEYLFETTDTYGYEDSNGIHHYTEDGIIDFEKEDDQ